MLSRSDQLQTRKNIWFHVTSNGQKVSQKKEKGKMKKEISKSKEEKARKRNENKGNVMKDR